MFPFVLLLVVVPSTPVVHGPRSTTDTTPTYRFSARENGVPAKRIHFLCAFDRPKLHACRARYSQRLSIGRHVLRVQAVDPAGFRSRIRKVRVTILRAGGPRLRRIQVGVPSRMAAYAIAKPRSAPATAVVRLSLMLDQYACMYWCCVRSWST